MEGPPWSGGAPPPGPPGRLPEHTPPRAPAGGCLKVLGVGCGAFVVLSLACLLLLYFYYGAVVAHVEMKFVLDCLAGSEVDPRVVSAVKQVLEEYDEARKREDLGVSQWREAAKAFSLSPAALVLAIIDAKKHLKDIPDLPPEVRERARRVLDRLAAAVAEGKASADDLSGLVKVALPAPAGAEEKPRPVEITSVDRQGLERLLPEAEKLLAERGIPEDPPPPDIPALLRRDLWASLAAGKAR